MESLFFSVKHISLYDLKTYPNHPFRQHKDIRFCKCYHNREFDDNASSLLSPLLTSHTDVGQVKSFLLL